LLLCCIVVRAEDNRAVIPSLRSRCLLRCNRCSNRARLKPFHRR